jgi:hypothetical protein
MLVRNVVDSAQRLTKGVWGRQCDGECYISQVCGSSLISRKDHLVQILYGVIKFLL